MTAAANTPPATDPTVPDAAPGNWVNRLAPATWRPYLRLARFDRPIGAWLLLFPCWWGQALGELSLGHPYPSPTYLLLFLAGAFVMRGAGCTMCGGSGYFDRIGVYEVLTLTDELRESIIEGRTPRATRQLAVDQGLRTLQAEAMDLVAHDMTTIDEALRHVFVAEDTE